MNNTLFPLFHINPVNVTTGLSSLTYNFPALCYGRCNRKENWTEANFQSADYLSNEQEVAFKLFTDLHRYYRNV